MRGKTPVLLAMFMVLVSILACSFVTGGGEEEVRLENLRMAFDEDGNNPTTVFAPADVFYAVGELYDAPSGTVVDASWLAVQIEGYEPKELIYEQTIDDFTEESFSGTIFFQLSNDSGWPVGDYQVDLFLNGNFVDSIPFSVQ